MLFTGIRRWEFITLWIPLWLSYLLFFTLFLWYNMNMIHNTMLPFVESKGKWAVQLWVSVLVASHLAFWQYYSVRALVLVESLVCHSQILWGSVFLTNTVLRSIKLSNISDTGKEMMNFHYFLLWHLQWYSALAMLRLWSHSKSYMICKNKAVIV